MFGNGFKAEHLAFPYNLLFIVWTSSLSFQSPPDKPIRKLCLAIKLHYDNTLVVVLTAFCLMSVQSDKFKGDTIVLFVQKLGKYSKEEN